MQEQDRKALVEALFQRFQCRVKAYCWCLTKNEDDAMDLENSMWVKVLRYGLDIEDCGDDVIFAKLAVRARNVFFSRRKRTHVGLQGSERDPRACDPAETNEAADLLSTLMASLESGQRDVLSRRLEGQKLHEVAYGLGITLSTAKHRSMTAIHQLRRAMRQSE